jgi:hypothetical protein
MDEISPALIAIVSGILAVATVAVIVSRNSSAPAAISASGGLLSSVISAAVKPVATASSSPSPSLASNVFTGAAANSFLQGFMGQ